MPIAVGPDWAGRITHLQSLLPDQGVAALVVSTPPNIAYLTGFTGSAGLLVLTAKQVVLITDGRYDLVVRQQMASGRIATVEVEKVGRRYDLTLAEVLGRLRLGQVGFEPAHLTVGLLAKWQRASPGVSWTPVEQAVERMRLIKDASEIAVFRRGGLLISNVASHLPAIVRTGRTEQEVAVGIEAAILDAGFTRLAFPTIVASGPNSALPHATPGSRIVQPGDLVVLDFGGVLDGYCLDLTRMAAAGPLSDQARALFDAVSAAHAAAVLAVRPGVAATEIDRAARSVLEDRGLGEAFQHSTGHGLGLEVHEAPRVGRPDPESAEVLEVGMVFTIEPGAYLESVGGVRLEDDVLVTTTGGEVLTTAPRELLVV